MKQLVMDLKAINVAKGHTPDTGDDKLNADCK